MSKKYAAGVVAVVVLAAGVALLVRGGKNSAPMPPANPTLDSNTVATNTSSPEIKQKPSSSSPEVIFDDSGFSPAALTIKRGETVIFKNLSSSDFWPASAVHPTHTAYSGTALQEHCPDAANVAFDACGPIPAGSSWSFKFDKVGTWNYHNHLRANLTGKIIVQ